MDYVRYGLGALAGPHYHSQDLPGRLKASLSVCHVTTTAVFSTVQCNCWHNLYKHTEFNQQLSRKAMLTNAMNGPMICILFGSSTDWSTPYTSLITMNNPEIAGCSSPDSYVLRIKSNNRNSLSSLWHPALRLPQHLSFLFSFGGGTRVLSSKSCYFLMVSPDSPASSTTKRK